MVNQPNNFSNEDILDTPRNIELLNKELYKYSVRLSGLSRTISLKWDLLNLDQESLEYIKKSGAKISAIPIFAPLKNYASKIESARRRIEDKTIFSQGERVVTAQVFPQVLAEGKELADLAARYREELEEKYLEGYNDFKDRIRNILKAPVFRLSESDIEEKVGILAGSFIDREEIQNFLQVKIVKSRIPSLSEQLKEQTEEAERFAALHTAKHLEEKARQGLDFADESERQDLLNLRSKIYEDTQSEVIDILNSTMAGIDSFEIDKPNTLLKKRIEKHLSRIRILKEFDTDGSFQSTADLLAEINKSLSTHNPKDDNEELENVLVENIQQIQQILKAIRQAQMPKQPRRRTLVL